MPQIHIDLRRDLPKVREQLEAVMRNMGICLYAAPCVIGTMVPPDRREELDVWQRGGTGLDALVNRGVVVMPRGQVDEARALQVAFDWRDRRDFERTLARLEAKYLTGEVA